MNVQTMHASECSVSVMVRFHQRAELVRVKAGCATPRRRRWRVAGARGTRPIPRPRPRPTRRRPCAAAATAHSTAASSTMSAPHGPASSLLQVCSIFYTRYSLNVVNFRQCSKFSNFVYINIFLLKYYENLLKHSFHY